MHLLLDTRIFLCWLSDDEVLPQKAREFIRDAKAVNISSASIWEAAIKIQLGKLKAQLDELTNAIHEEGFIELPTKAKHISLAAQLPNHHRDTIDRILIAQAMNEPLRFLTFDHKLKIYSELVEVVNC